jgi:hypothetical protein
MAGRGKTARRAHAVALRHIRDWADLHAEDLAADWQRVLNKEPPEPIAPLL